MTSNMSVSGKQDLEKDERSDSPEPSCVSMRSDRSMYDPIHFREQDSSTNVRSQKKKSNISRYQLESIFTELEDKVIILIKNELKRFRKLLSTDYSAWTKKEVENKEELNRVREGALKITLHVLRSMNHTDLANALHNKCVIPVNQSKLKSNLKEKCKRINEGISQHGSSALLNEIYTELYITEGWSGDINKEHEVRQIEALSRRPATQETPIKCNELFKDKSIRTVLTKGVAGIGKTVSVQKFILDWAEGKANQDVFFMLPLPFRELNLMKKENLSLMNLLHHFFPEIRKLELIDCDSYKVVLIFDGLDECRLPLNFQSNVRLCDVTETASVDVLLTNLIKGNLLPSALLWITSRPGAANQIPPECVDQVTELRGFSDPQKEEYFRKRISDQSLANKIITHMKSSRSLYIMCHIPVFCWISATVLERMLGETESGEIPKTLTQMFTHFLIFQIKHKDQKYNQKYDSHLEQTRASILALGKLAFHQLEKGNLIFYEEDMRDCGIDVREVSVYSGMCTQIFSEVFGLHLKKVFSFVHLTVQEFLAALYTFVSFISRNETEQQTTDLSDVFRKSNMSDFLISAVDKALQSENGHLDLFLRFLLGLSLESNQTLLHGLIPQTGSSSHSKQETVEYIKMKIRETPSPEKSINLFHCLNELNDHSLVHEVQTYLNRGGFRCLSGTRLSPAQWSALVFVLLNSKQELDVFDLRKYDRSNECLLRLLPVVRSSRKAVLHNCNLTEESCRVLSSVLSSNSSSLRELDLNDNKLQDSGVKLLSAGLKNPQCRLEMLRMCNCSIRNKGCVALASALKSNSTSHLRELDLSFNNPGESGVKMLSDLLKDLHCKLETIQIESIPPLSPPAPQPAHPTNHYLSQKKELEHKVITLMKNVLKRFKKPLSPDYPVCTERDMDDQEDLHSVREGMLKITLHVLKIMNHTDLANTLHNKGWSGDINKEHEVSQIETASRRPATQETPIKCNELFKDKSIRAVLTKGVAGIGKTVSVQKFILDWAEGKANQDVFFMFPLPFRELDLMKKENLSLMNFLHHFFPEIRKLELIDCDSYKVVLIFDGVTSSKFPEQ
ncbi:hypothetical protein QTP70_034467 [Hemibagrus guttatus]|uniref:NACHT domain-containing protein n=1 Tax=Hemibagrus guttatus TaxID=175788 RepID=A0AAE0R4Z2_9TELE|nr:hypothetical protein QTP70_034467 [Hemibagrus guttatus]